MIFLYEAAFDALEPELVATFWASALRYDMVEATPEEIEAAYAAHPDWRNKAVREDLPARHLRLYVQRVPEPKYGRNRVRFEIGLPPSDDVSRLLSLGAVPVTDGSYADPEGNEFAVVEVPDGPPRMTTIVIDALDPGGQASFWASLLSWKRDGYVIRPPVDWLTMRGGVLHAFGQSVVRPFPGGMQPPDGPAHVLAPEWRFVPATEPKSRKNRIHFDLVCTSPTDYRDERARVRSLGARNEDYSLGHKGMFDPEGNEFCLADPRLDALRGNDQPP